MSIDYAEASPRARDQPAFANGTEGFAWTNTWCGDCQRDAPFRNGLNPSGCPLIVIALEQRTPAEWIDGPRDRHGRYSLDDQYQCIEYRPPGSRPPEPRPRPEPPLMDGLFPRPTRRVRMLTQPTTAAALEEDTAR